MYCYVQRPKAYVAKHLHIQGKKWKNECSTKQTPKNHISKWKTSIWKTCVHTQPTCYNTTTQTSYAKHEQPTWYHTTTETPHNLTNTLTNEITNLHNQTNIWPHFYSTAYQTWYHTTTEITDKHTAAQSNNQTTQLQMNQNKKWG